MKTNKKLLIIAIFIASILSFSFFTLARYTNKVSLTGTIKTEKIKIEFNPLSNSEYEKNVSSTVTVNNLSGANLTELKYVWSKTEVDASTGTTFASGDAINVPEIEGEYYLCVYAEDENNFYNNKCSNKFYVDNKAPVIEYSTEEISGTNYLVVEVTEEGSGLKTLTNENNLTLANQVGNKYYYALTNDPSFVFTAIDNLDNENTKTYAFCDQLEGTVYNFDYTGNYQELQLVCGGEYRVELWGAKGGNSLVNGSGSSNPAYGGYTAGNIFLEPDKKLYIYVGQKGTNASGSRNSAAAWNGGGLGTWDNADDESSGAGGGATDIRYFGSYTPTTDELTWNSSLGLASRIMVAGGAGGKSFNYNGASGGGLTGYNSTGAKGGTQTSGSAFGIGQNGSGTADSDGVAGGGGGYWGGKTSNTGGKSSGAGGSSYISGHPGCIAIASATSTAIKDGCNASSTSLECSIHYSNMYFYDTSMIDGNGYAWTTTKGSQVNQVQPDGTISTGHTGNGYARITYVTSNPEYTISFSPNNGIGGQSGNMTIYYNQNMPELSVLAPTREGYIFTGYYDNPDYKNGTKYYDADLSTTKKYDRFGSVTLYAGWKITVGTVDEMNYTGTIEEYNVTTTGLYKLEVWGAQGGDATATFVGGNGGYSMGYVYLEENDKLYYAIGGQGENITGATKTCLGGFNGGGNAKTYTAATSAAAGGGGATHIGLFNSTLAEHGDTTDLLIVAAGGGGGHFTNTSNQSVGGVGGGLEGSEPTNMSADLINNRSEKISVGGKQDSISCTMSGKYCSSFGSGANAIALNVVGSGGGGGLYGGSTALYGSGAGGSSYIDGVINGITISGDAEMPSYTDNSTIIGNSGNGYARITYLGENPEYIISFSPNNGVGGQSANITARFNETMPTLTYAIPTRENYVFMGYYDNPDYAQGTKYYNVDGTSAHTFDRAKNITLYAGWKGIDLTVSFDANEGTVDTPSKTVEYNKTYLELPTPTREDYTFMGWHGKNFFNIYAEENIALNQNFASSSKRKFVDNTYVAGMSSNNNYDDTVVSDIKIARENSNIKFTTSADYGVGYAINNLSAGTYTLSYDGVSSEGNAKVAVLFYSNDGSLISREEETATGLNSITFTLPEGTVYTLIVLTADEDNVDVEYSNIQLEKNNKATLYEKYYVDENTLVSVGSNHTLTAIWSNKTEYNYAYTGGIQNLKIPETGLYKLEVWGASGGAGLHGAGGLGGYSEGEVFLTQNTTIYIVVGNEGATIGNTSTYTNGGYNGGGAANYQAGSGGGATHIAKASGLLSALGASSFVTNKNGYIVAGGGGGGAAYTADDMNIDGGAGGGLQGLEDTISINSGKGGTQTAGGAINTSATGTKGAAGSFGTGGKGGNQFSYGSGAGGGGLYGGGAGSSYNGSGGGGSSYINGVLNGSTVSGVNQGKGKAKITFLGNNTFYEVTLDPNNGIGGLNYNLKVLYGKQMPTIYSEIPTRLGYIFTGYYDNADYKLGEKYYNADLTPAKDYDKQENITLYAGWQIDVDTAEDFTYTGEYVEYNVNNNGIYKIEAWGAQGGDDANSIGGKGGYSKGNIYLTDTDTLYFYVGQKGPANSSTTNKGGWNGGGYSGNASGSKSYGGGGATDVRLVKASDTKTVWNNFDSLKSRILIAAGGGGTFANTSYTRIPGAGGGLAGYDADGSYNGTNPTGATQTTFGLGNSSSKNGAFGYALQSNVSGWGGGGGGGYYGGAMGTGKAGSGGSSFISGHAGCDALTETSTSSARVHTGSENHYSGYIFEGTLMIDGEGYIWTTTKGNYVGQVQPDGTITDGHAGDGYLRITYLGENPTFELAFSPNNGMGGQSANVEAVFEENLPKLNYSIPVRAGYTFTGYYDHPDYKLGRKYFDVSGNPIGQLELASDITLYAGWQATAGTVEEFDYTGDMQLYNITATGIYQLEVWGASGGSYSEDIIGGYGAYSFANIKLNEDEKIYIGVGGQGNMATEKKAVSVLGGFNGGGNAYGSTDRFVGSGGGATHIGYFNETLATHGNNDGLFIVAGGGGGSAYQNDNAKGNGGNGGGYIGNDGTRSATTYPLTTGATQVAGGTGYNQSGAANNGTFGQGSGITAASGTGAGGGYYGGGAGRYWVGASGGSGYIASPNLITTNKKMVCYNCQESTDIDTYTESNTCVDITATSNCSKLGNGHARITFLGPHPEYTVSFSSNNGTGGQTANVIAGYEADMPTITSTAPTRENYVFMGWYDNPEYLNGTKYYNADGTSARQYDRLENVTLYAGWEGVPIEVTFDIGGGETTDSTTKTVNFGRAYGEMPTPIRDGYGFIGYHLKNFFDINVDDAEPSDTNFSSDTQRTFTMATYNSGLSSNNNYDPTILTDVEVDNNYLSFTSSEDYGVGYVFKGLEKTPYTLSYTGTSSDGSNKVVILYYDEEGNYLSNVENIGTNSITFTPIENATYEVVLFTTTGDNSDVTYGSIQLEKGDAQTSYERYIEIEDIITVTKNHIHVLYVKWIDVPIGTQWIFDYTGNMQSFEAPAAGIYQLEVWGGRGNGTYGGAGGYSIGQKRLNNKEILYVGVGGQGQTFNGGAKGTSTFTGGGGTHIGRTNAEIKNTLPEDLLIVAGGGGGSNNYSGGGSGGGLSGGGGGSTVGANNENHGTGGRGGTQTAGGQSTSASSNDYGNRWTNPGSYGQGGVGYSLGGNTSAGGGGGGYYGGAGGLANGYNSGAAGGGGSGYIGGVDNGLTYAGVRSGDGQAIITYLGASNKGSFKRKYQTLEYIESTGSQRIDTDYILKPNTGIETRFQYTAATASQRLFGIYTESNLVDTLNYSFWINGSTKFAYSYNDNIASYVASTIAPGTTEHTLEFNMNNNKKVKIDDTELNITATPVNMGTVVMPIFAGYNLAGNAYANYSKVKLYSFKIYEDNTLVADFVPCKLRYGSSIGLCDRISGTMYHNAGSGMFTAGSAID